MTIDEAIAKYKEITNTDANCPAHCNISCDKCVQESEQLTEWLEELKEYKKNSNICPICDTYCSYLAEEFENGYNKAIDDFVNFASTMPTVEQKDGTIRPMWLKEMTEQLKVGVENEQCI